MQISDDLASITSAYFRPGTQSLGLTTEDLFWTGNINWNTTVWGLPK